ncbi:MAG: hypothetical protein ABR511_05925 [Acidimicrobiales bacterium]
MTARRPVVVAGGGGRWWAILEAVGFNPYRPSRRRPSDYAFVVAALVVTAALLVWAFL